MYINNSSLNSFSSHIRNLSLPAISFSFIIAYVQPSFTNSFHSSLLLLPYTILDAPSSLRLFFSTQQCCFRICVLASGETSCCIWQRGHAELRSRTALCMYVTLSCWFYSQFSGLKLGLLPISSMGAVTSSPWYSVTMPNRLCWSNLSFISRFMVVSVFCMSLVI